MKITDDAQGRAVAFALGAGAVVVWMYLSGPSTFEECLMEGALKASNELAVKAVAQGCRAEFPQRSGG